MSQTNNNSLLITPTTQFNCGLDHGTNEFAIIGDDLVIESQNSVPDWFVNIIGGIVNSNVQNLYDSMLNYNSNLLGALGQIEVAKNTYAQYISKVITDESAYVAALTTLNSTIQGNDATIRQLLQTYATSDYAVASAAQLLTASLNGGTIGARIGSAESAMATQYGALAQRLNQLESSFTDSGSQTNANATAIQRLTTYTGMGEFDGLPAVIANSNFYRRLDAYLDGTNYRDVGGSNNLIQDVTAISTEKASMVESKFAYDSVITLDGKDYRAGFGLFQLGTISEDGVTYESEFRVVADKFRVLSSEGEVGTAPFQVIDGVTYLTWDNITGDNKPQEGATRNINMGEWSSRTAEDGPYLVGDIVQYNNSSYVCIVPTYTAVPTDSGYWTLLAGKGEDSQSQVNATAFFRAIGKSVVAPTGGSYASPVPTSAGWSDGIPDGTAPLWQTTRIFTSDGMAPQQGSWTAPRIVANTSSVKYQFSTDNSNWSDTASVSSVFMRTGTSSDGGATWTYTEGVKVKGEQGDKGVDGNPGSRGAYTVSYGADLGSLSVASATSSAGMYFQYGGGPSTFINGDSLVLTNSSATNGWTNIYRYNGSAWANSTVLKIDGDAVVKGTLSVDKLRSGYLGNGAYYVAVGGGGVANQQGAVIGFAPGSAVGVVGQSSFGTGVHGSSMSGGSGVYGYGPSGIGVSGYGIYGVDGIGTTTGIKGYGYSHGGHFQSGVIDVYVGSGAYGKAIYAAAGDIFTTGTYFPFTGSHEALVDNIDGWVAGDIVEDTGKATHIDISNAIVKVQLAAEKSSAVVGVYTNEDLIGSPLLTEYLEKENKVIVKTKYVSVVGDSKFIHMNSLGEGLVNVCGLNGDISVGDLIVASKLPGKGMKQEDDLVRSCTVAKSRESVKFDYPEQVKQVACIYMCG